MKRNLVYEATERKECPGSYIFTWDGTMNMMGEGGYYVPEEEQNNIAPSGLYTFDVEVKACPPYDRDVLRSEDLSVIPGPIEFLGYDDAGTPEDEEDDAFLYYLRWYTLRSHRAIQARERYGFMTLI